MQLVINTYSAYLKKSGECFVIKYDDKVLEVSPRKVESIMITTSAYQYAQDRDNRELLFDFKKHALVHFAVDPDEVYKA